VPSEIAPAEFLRRERHRSIIIIGRARDLQEIGCGFVIHEAIEHSWNLQRYAGPHQNVSHAPSMAP
jgi:hypothetical protein